MPNNQPCRILGCLSGHLSNLAPLVSNIRGYVKVQVELLLGILYQVQGSRFPILARPKYGRGRLSNTCMIVSPIDVTAQSCISIVGAEYVPSRDVVVRVC